VNKILIVEDEKSMRDVLTLTLRKEGYKVDTVESAVAARERMEKDPGFDLVITDISMPGGMTGLDLLRHARRNHPDAAIVLMTAYGTKETAIEALNDGATYYVEKPFDLDELKVVVRKTMEQRRMAAENVDLKLENRTCGRSCGAVPLRWPGGRSSKMRAIFELIERVATTGSTILIQGEERHGKELIARAIHYNSGRETSPSCPSTAGRSPTSCWRASCSATCGAASPAPPRTRRVSSRPRGGHHLPGRDRRDLARHADEAAARPPGAADPTVGGTEEIEVDVRVIAATNQDLERMVRDRAFREDLFYRINVIPLRMPACRRSRRTSRPGRPLPGEVPQGHGEAAARHLRSRHGVPGGIPLAGERASAGERHRAARWRWRARTWSSSTTSPGGRGGSSVAPTWTSSSRRRRGPGPAPGGAASPLHDGSDGALLRVQTRAAELLGMTFRSFRYFAKKYGMSVRDGGEGARGRRPRRRKRGGAPWD
jgi:CheY-like chemotaxis protein